MPVGSDYSAEDDDATAVPTAGERVVYALAQLYRLHAAGRLPVEPAQFAVEDVARIVGVVDADALRALAKKDGVRLDAVAAQAKHDVSEWRAVTSGKRTQPLANHEDGGHVAMPGV